MQLRAFTDKYADRQRAQGAHAHAELTATNDGRSGHAQQLDEAEMK